jgi:hypothetical protein
LKFDLSQSEKFGFEQSGIFHFLDGAVESALQKHSGENGCYMFVLDSRILYVGSTLNTLRNRIYQYCNPGPSQQTNIRLNEYLKTELSEHPKVDIYFNPEENIKKMVLSVEGYGASTEIDIPLMERFMITAIDPPWNRSKLNSKHE